MEEELHSALADAEEVISRADQVSWQCEANHLKVVLECFDGSVQVEKIMEDSRYGATSSQVTSRPVSHARFCGFLTVVATGCDLTCG